MLQFDKNWSLFLDRDGVINQRIPNDYVKKWDEFVFIDKSLQAIAMLSKLFGHVFVVTNQAGIGKKLMTEADLNEIHRLMLEKINLNHGKIDKVYHAPDLPNAATILRKPNIGMALQAKQDFPEVIFQQSVMVGDSVSDIEFGKRAGMVTVFITGKGDDPSVVKPDFIFQNLLEFALSISGINKEK